MAKDAYRQGFTFRRGVLIGVSVVIALRVFASLFDVVQGRTWLHAWVVGDLATVLGWVFLSCGILSLIPFFPIRGFRSVAHLFAPVGLLSYWGHVALSGDEIRILPVEYGIVIMLVLSSAIRVFFAFRSSRVLGNLMGLAVTSLILGCLSCLGTATGLAAVVCAAFPLLSSKSCNKKCRDLASAGAIAGLSGDLLKWLGLHLVDAFWMWLLR